MLTGSVPISYRFRDKGGISVENASNTGATENAGVENAIQTKLQGLKMQEWKMRE